ncbi:hypothetical protein [Nocardia neocaledoniensis]|nr:hypothetical protein [Nocardia neocaledoniensis]
MVVTGEQHPCPPPPQSGLRGRELDFGAAGSAENPDAFEDFGSRVLVSVG